MIELSLEDELVGLFQSRKHDLTVFMEGVLSHIGRHPKLNNPNRPVIHSSKSRIKDEGHLRDKILRKIVLGTEITKDNFLKALLIWQG